MSGRQRLWNSRLSLLPLDVDLDLADWTSRNQSQRRLSALSGSLVVRYASERLCTSV